LMAAAIVRGLTRRLSTGAGSEVRASLARTAKLLVDGSQPQFVAASLESEARSDHTEAIELTAWGPARRVKPPAIVDGVPMHWDYPSTTLGSSPAAW